MMTLLAISVSSILWGLFVVLCFIVMLAILWMGYTKLDEIWHFPPLVKMMVATLLILGGIALMIVVILSLIGGQPGHQIFTW